MLNQDIDKRVPLKHKFNSSKIYIPLETDFTEREFVYTYYGSGDVMKGIGGINRIIKSVMEITLPFMTMSFVYTLSRILLFKYI